jgi:UDP-N-acetylmuramoyl-tripeptide--D-alanyl-D-alanine ligase
VFAVGELAACAADAFGEGGEVLADQQALVARLRTQLGARLRVLVKGSRGSRMEQVVAALLDPDAPGGSDAA